MSDTEILDAEIVHEPAAETPASTSVELAPRQRRSEVIRPLDAEALVESFEAYQQLLPRLLNAGDYQSTGTDKNGKERKFVKKSGWRKIATAFDLDVQLIRSIIERDSDGKPLRAEVWARAIAPSGRSMDGDGYCSVDEERFGKPGEADWKIQKARAKLENDLRATATTRAMNRAISGLVGMGEVSAEEVGDGDGSYGKPPYGDPLAKEQNPAVGQAIRTLLAVHPEDVPDSGAFAAEIIKDAGYFPAVVGRVLLRLEHAFTERQQQTQVGEPS